VSTSLITATGTTGAAAIALIAFASGLHVIGVAAVALWSTSGAALFSSAFAGGLAIRRVSSCGSNGDWGLNNPRSFWWVQICAFALGAALLTVGSIVAFSGPAQGSTADKQAREIQRLSSTLRLTRQRQTVLLRDVNRIEQRLSRHSGHRLPRSSRP
jgi:hypothetical protein